MHQHTLSLPPCSAAPPFTPGMEVGLVMMIMMIGQQQHGA